jgi:hypothetical protein
MWNDNIGVFVAGWIIGDAELDESLLSQDWIVYGQLVVRNIELEGPLYILMETLPKTPGKEHTWDLLRKSGIENVPFDPLLIVTINKQK